MIRTASFRTARRQLSTVARREPLLFTPGPLTTSHTVKQAMQVDLGSRDSSMISVVREIRSELLAMGHVSQETGYECVLMQGSGTACVESVLTSVVPRDGRLLVLSNGAYGERIAKMATISGIAHRIVRFAEREAVCPGAVERALGEDKYSHVAVIHHETTAGALNPIEQIGEVVRRCGAGASYFVDSMSAFGAYDVDLQARPPPRGRHQPPAPAAPLTRGRRMASTTWSRRRTRTSRACPASRSRSAGARSCSPRAAPRAPSRSTSARRCTVALSASVCLPGAARCPALRSFAQWEGLENGGQFRFTPPTHAMLAFRQVDQ